MSDEMKPAAEGAVLALSLVVPLGVQNTFVLLQGATHASWVRALPAAVVAATCDTALILLAVGGVSVAVASVPTIQGTVSWAGVVFLAVMGGAIWRAPCDAVQANGQERWPLHRQVLYTASVSLLNPHALLDTVGVIGTASLRFTAGHERWLFTLACVTVSWCWFMLLVSLGRMIGARQPSASFLRTLNRVSALIMWVVAWQIILGLTTDS